MHLTTSKNIQDYIKISPTPIDIGSRMGSTGYIDFKDGSIVHGIDCENRYFISACYKDEKNLIRRL